MEGNMEIINTLLLIALIVVIILDKKPQKKPEKVKLTREEKEKMEQAKKSFENLMNYDEKQAMRKE